MAVPKHYFIGILYILYELLIKRNEFVSGYSLLSCLMWNSIFVLFFAILSRTRFFRRLIGNKGILLVVMLSMIQFFLPMDIPQQRIIFVDWLKPVGNLLRTPIYGTIRVKELLIYIWIAGILIQTVVYLVSRVRMSRLKRTLPKTEAAVPAIVKPLMPARTVVYTCYGISVPMSVWGYRRMILIPQRDYEEREICNIIRHESWHLKLYDHVTVFMADMLCIIYWWNPCVYILRHNIEKNLEMRCDLEAVKEMSREEAAEYMATLVTVFKGRYGGIYSGLGLLGNRRNLRSDLKERFLVLESELTEKQHRWVNVLIAVMIITLMLVSDKYVFSPFYMPSEYTGGVIMPTGEWEDSLGEDDYITAKTVMVSESAYIIDYGDGMYILHNPFSEQIISEEWADALVESGVRIQKKEP